MPNTMTAAEFAVWCGVTTRTLRDWVAKGMPRAGSGRSVRYGPESAKWAREYQSNENAAGQVVGELTEEQARKTKIEADRAALKLARERKEVALISDFQCALEKHNAVIKQKLTSLPVKMAGELVNIDNKATIKDKLEAEIVEVLAELRNTPEKLLE